MELFAGQREIKRRTCSMCRFRPDTASQPLDNTFARSQSDAAPRRVGPMQALERKENLFGILGIEALTVIADEYNPVPPLLSRADLEIRRLVGTEFNGITDQIL